MRTFSNNEVLSASVSLVSPETFPQAGCVWLTVVFSLPTLSQSDQFSQILSSLYSVHDNGTLMPSQDALMECLKNILKLPGQGEIYIVVDALDECPKVSGILMPREQVLTIIKKIFDLRLPHVHLCITSCLEVNIWYVLEGLALHAS